VLIVALEDHIDVDVVERIDVRLSGFERPLDHPFRRRESMLTS
jgi:hypothetical protein